MSARSPQEVAHLAADTMWANDPTSRELGMELVEIAPGRAVLAMTVAPHMTNGHDTAHGGFLFTLADSAFAFACNSYGDTTVAAHCSITFVRPGRRGDRLVATAQEVSRSGRSGIYDVTIAREGVTIALFRGHSRTIGGSFIAPAENAPQSSDSEAS
ncbi:hydroxyphenylacetyl-CoA thioesterase PaaI [Azorhizobium doebereinerae]|uniref:hydroxyphenylacetyl-CoA thioesterase PaaI n=1 Tax=Azorhizobium doebereinerae TaxID=281091 RepID=UPI00048B8F8D|nr:hydroxyphenylacetyl-CoA thioesterase PaaI [Azorhizobium doebereinerae]